MTDGPVTADAVFMSKEEVHAHPPPLPPDLPPPPSRRSLGSTCDWLASLHLFLSHPSPLSILCLFRVPAVLAVPTLQVPLVAFYRDPVHDFGFFRFVSPKRIASSLILLKLSQSAPFSAFRSASTVPIAAFSVRTRAVGMHRRIQRRCCTSSSSRSSSHRRRRRSGSRYGWSATMLVREG